MHKKLFMAALTAAVLAAPSALMAQTAVTPAKAIADNADYGVEQDLVNEDFSKFSTGTEENPDFSANINTDLDSKVEYFENVKPEYTTLPRWGAAHAFPAGGAVCLYSDNANESAHINTPFFDATQHGNVFVIRFRARLLEKQTDYTSMGLHVMDFSESEDNGNYRIITTVNGVTDEWRTFELVCYGGTKRMLVNFTEESQSKLLIDDVKILQFDQYVETPNVLPHRNYTGTSFSPTWNKVEGAESYVLNVYNSDEYGTIGDPLVENMQTTDTICTVRGLLPGNIYRYNVTAVAGSHHSIPSANVELFDLSTPSFESVDDLNDGQFTAAWSIVPRALYYNYYLYDESVAEKDGERTIIDEDFNNVTDWGGDKQDWEAGSTPEYVSKQGLGYPVGLNMAGWTASEWVPLAAGYVALDGWNYFYDVRENVKDPELTDDIKTYARLQTAELDLSKDEGRFSVSADLYGEYAEDSSDKEHNYPKYQTNGVIALYNYNFSTGQYEEAESKHFELSPAWNTYTAEFTKGSENSKIAVYATDGPGFLFVDNLKAKQHFAKGESFIAPQFMRPGFTDTRLVVELPEGYSDRNFYQRVEAAAQRDVFWATMTYTFYSRLADLDPVYTVPTAISSTKADAARMKVRVAGDDIVVAGVGGQSVEVYNAGGACVAKAVAHTDNVALHVTARGVYVVKAGGQSVKVVK